MIKVSFFSTQNLDWQKARRLAYESEIRTKNSEI